MFFNKRPKLALILYLAFISLSGFWPIRSLAAELLANSGFDNPFNDIPGRLWRDQNEKIAGGWTPFYIPGATYEGDDDAPKLHWMSSAQFAAAFGGFDYKLEGDQAQNIWSSYEFEAGVYQQINGLTPGQAYGFDIAIVTYWRGPGYPDTDGKMVKQVGIDPYGGVDPTSSTIIWGKTNANDKAWVYLDVAATAQANTITVFAKIQAPENDSFNHTDLDMVYLDAAHVDLAPTATLSLSNNGPTINATWSGGAAPGWSIKGYEVQYRDQTQTGWTTLQSKNNPNTAQAFTGLPGHTYIIRLRLWQTKAEAYNDDIDLPGVWVEQQITLSNAIIGRVMNHMGYGLDGVAISIGGATPSTQSAGGGEYGLFTGGPGTFSVVAGNLNDLVAPPATTITIPTNGIGAVDIMLRPAGDKQAIQNNDFEIDLSNWTVSDGPAAAMSTADHHSGQGSLLMTTPVEVSQLNPVTAMDRPFLSFWYKSDAGFVVEFLTATGPVQAKTLAPTSAWTLVTLESDLGEAYSGLVGVKFSFTGDPANIYIDEVGIAAGPLKTFLPTVMK